MSKQSKRKGVSYYFRLEFSTLQGKITTGFCLLGVFAIILMSLATYILYPAVERSQIVASQIKPAQTQLYLIAQNLTYISSNQDSELLTTYAASAKNSAEQVSSTSAFDGLKNNKLDLQVLIRRINSLHEKSLEVTRVESGSPQANALQADIQQLTREARQLTSSLIKILNSEEIRLNASAENRKSNIFWILAASTVLSIVLGAAIGSFIVVNVLKIIKMLKLKILEISEGKLIGQIPETNNELNSIVKALNKLTDNLENIQFFAQEVGKGNFDTDIQVFEGKNHLGVALAEMRDSLKRVSVEEEHRSWNASGLAKFSNLLRASTDNIQEYCQTLLNELVRYINVNQGALYIITEQNGEVTLQRIAAYAYGRVKHGEQFLKPGQGLAGQVYLEKLPVYLEEIPNGYTEITSGLGEATPSNLILFPLIFNEKVSGVLELASFGRLETYKQDFLEKISESIASALHHVENANSTADLLAEAQQMTEAMKMQEEMLRQNSEELMATQEQLTRDMEEVKQNSLYYEAGFADNPFPMAVIDGNGLVLHINTKMQNLGLNQGADFSAIASLDQLAEASINGSVVPIKINQRDFAARLQALDTPQAAHILVMQSEMQEI
jgi:HAMP domain-containing protein